MNLIKAAVLIQIGYILRDQHLAPRKVQYVGRYSEKQNSLGEYFKNLSMDKMDMIFYGAHGNRNGALKQFREPRRPAYASSYGIYSVIKPERETRSYTPAFFTDRKRALQLHHDLYDLLKSYGQASIVDYYDMAEEQMVTDFADNRYGWKEEDISADPLEYLEEDPALGFYLDLPEPRKLY